MRKDVEADGADKPLVRRTIAEDRIKLKTKNQKTKNNLRPYRVGFKTS